MRQQARGITYEAAVQLLQKAYTAFNARDIDAVLKLMHTNVNWPNGWEGGYVHGHDGVRDYWQRQWAAINPQVEPVSFEETYDGRICVNVHQVVKDLDDIVLVEGMVQHIYTIENCLVQTMEIRQKSEV